MSILDSTVLTLLLTTSNCLSLLRRISLALWGMEGSIQVLEVTSISATDLQLHRAYGAPTGLVQQAGTRSAR